jgi:hypothetical protein
VIRVLYQSTQCHYRRLILLLTTSPVIAQPLKDSTQSDTETHKNFTSSRDTTPRLRNNKYTPIEKKTGVRCNTTKIAIRPTHRKIYHNRLHWTGSLTFKYNGIWKLYTKAKTSPITAIISTKHLVMKPITIMLTIF